jgi:hypothetical protein
VLSNAQFDGSLRRVSSLGARRGVDIRSSRLAIRDKLFGALYGLLSRNEELPRPDMSGCGGVDDEHDLLSVFQQVSGRAERAQPDSSGILSVSWGTLTGRAKDAMRDQAAPEIANKLSDPNETAAIARGESPFDPRRALQYSPATHWDSIAA